MIVVTTATCMLISLILSGIESIVLNTNRARLYHYAKAGDSAAISLRALLTQRDCLLVTIITFSAVFRIVGLALLYSLLKPQIGMFCTVLIVTLSLPLLILLLVVFSQEPCQRLLIFFMITLAGVLRFSQKLMWPMTSLVLWLSSHFIGHNKRSTISTAGATLDIGRAVSLLAKKGKLSHTADQLIQNFLKFRNQKIFSFVTPIQKAVYVRPDTPICELFALARRHTGIEQILVVGECKQHIVGVIDIFDLLLKGSRVGKAQSHARQIVSVTSTETLCTVVRKMRAAKSSMCAVTERMPGHVLGVVAKETLLRHLFIGETTHHAASSNN